MSEQHTEKYLRTRRFRLFLPVLIVPIVVIFFWLMGGGTTAATVVNKKSGLNTELPRAQVVKDSVKDKLAFYVAAEADSSKRMEQLRMDPYRKDTVQSNANKEPAMFARTNNETDAIANKIAVIQRRIEISNNAEPSYNANKAIQVLPVQKSAVSAPDAEMEAINSTLDKLMAIQRPAQQNKAAIKTHTTVMPGAGQDEDYFGRKDTVLQKQFLSDEKSNESVSFSFAAIIPVTQTLQTGSVIKIQLLQPLQIAGNYLPAGSLLFGTASLENERLKVQIPSVRAGREVVPVSLAVFDMDGLEGIYVPGSITRDVIKSTAEQSVQSFNMLSLDPSIKTQVAMAGIGAAKNLLSRKVHIVRATVSAGYRVFLKNDK